jgi:hypothetical protein
MYSSLYIERERVGYLYLERESTSRIVERERATIAGALSL